MGKRLLVDAPLHQIQLVVCVGEVPENVTARLQEHEVELVREAGLR